MTGAERYRLRLYVAGVTSVRSQMAIDNVNRICGDHLGKDFDLEIVDIRLDPEEAEVHNIVVVPTLSKEAPPPPRRLVGDLTITERVLQALSLPREGPAASVT